MSEAATVTPISTDTIQEALQRAKQLAAQPSSTPSAVSNSSRPPAEVSWSNLSNSGSNTYTNHISPPQQQLPFGGTRNPFTNTFGNGHPNSNGRSPANMMDTSGMGGAGMPAGMGAFGAGFMGGSMNGTNGGGGDVNVEQIEVPDQCVGLVIGRGGENINNIQNQSGCRVQLAPDSGGKPTRSCTLQGTRQNIEAAKSMIMEVISKAGTRSAAGGGGMGGVLMGGGRSMAPGGGMMAGIPASLAAAVAEQAQSGQNVTYEMMIPGPKCGLIIGKGGETIKSLQERAGVKMVMIQETSDPCNHSKPLRVIGPPDKIEYAKSLVEEVLNSRDDNPPRGSFGRGIYQQKSVGEVIVPKASVGMIIGKGGENIKRMATESGAKIQFKQDEDPDGNERTAVIQGTPDEIQRATSMISDVVNKAMNGMVSGMGGGGGLGGGGGGGSRDGQECFYMHVPATKTGLVIGKGGETIRQIAGESGAHVELSRDPPPNENEKIFVIKGSAYQIHHATHLVRIKVGDLPPGTPLPPFSGALGAGGGGGAQMGGFSAQQPNMYGGANPYQGWNDYGAQQQQQQVQQQTNQQATGGLGGGGAGGDPAAAAWQQYYQHQQFSNGAAQGQPGAPPGAAQPPTGAQPQAQQPGGNAAGAQPAINPATGQLDYSAQWAEYYRNIGMHEQAALIEQQAKQSAIAQRAVVAQAAAAVAAQQQTQQPAAPGFYSQQQAAAAQFGGVFGAGAGGGPTPNNQQQQFPGFNPGGPTGAQY